MAPLARSRTLAAGFAVAVAVVVTVVGGSWLLRRAAGEIPAQDIQTAPESPWQVLPNTFPVDDYWLSGPFLILPGAEGCFVAFGQDNIGTAVISGYWRSTNGCSGAARVGPSYRPVGDGLPSYGRSIVLAAVPTGDGGYLAISRQVFEGDLFAYESQAVYVDPYHPDEQQQVQVLAEFSTDTPKQSYIGPAAVVATEAGYVAVGRHDDAAVAWTSTDGVSWRQSRLPDAGLNEAPRVSGLTAGPDGRLVAVGTGGTSGFTEVPAGWVSTDGGAHWTQARMPETGARPHLRTVVHTGAEFVALGAEDGAGGPASALVLTSPDGVTWTRDESLAAAGGRRVSTATVLPGGELVAVSEDGQPEGEDPQGDDPQGEDPPGPDERCAAAWLQDADGWTREPIGCHGIPTGVTALDDGSIAAVHWSTLFLRPTAG